MMAMDESDSQGVWLFLFCNFSLEFFSVLHFSSAFILATGGSILPVFFWWLAVSETAVPHPLRRLGFYIARSAMFPVSPGARRATTTVWVGARGRGPAGGGGRRSQSFLLSTQASPSY